MKKKIIISIIVLIFIIVLFTPLSIKMYKDGGTRTYTSLTYKIVKWNKIINANEIYKKTSVFWFPSNLKSVDELWEIEKVNKNDNNVSIVLQTYDNKGLTYIFNNETSKTYFCSEAYNLSVFKKNEWISVPYITDDAVFGAVVYTLKKYAVTEKMDVNWLWLYGELSDGKYKFEKDVIFKISSVEYESITISAEFELVNGEGVKVISYTLTNDDEHIRN